MSETVQKKRARRATGYVFLVIFLAVAVVGLVFHNELYGENAWVTSNPTSNSLVNWLLALTPRVVTSVSVLFVTLLVLYVVCAILSRIFRGTPRKETIGKLTKSIVKVVVWVVGIIFFLAVWGIDVTALVAGAGVLTLVIGLGMQSLIADVVAGIFLVCDGTMQVGDIVTIDGWRGTVQEIGIRNTKLINYSGDVRIMNNSTVKTFINQSRNPSYPLVTVGVEYDEDLKRIEKVFEKNREKLRELCPLITDGPDYKGVSELGESSVNLLFGATCNEADFAQVQRDLTRALYLVFEENDIHVPFPQVVVHDGDKGKKK